jgi:hypothetical protein
MTATRLYFGRGAPLVSPALTTAGWTGTGSAVRRTLETATAQPDSAFESLAVAGATAGARTDYMVAQYTSAKLDVNQTIAGNVKGQLRAQISNTAAKAVAQMFIWVRKDSDGTNRGTLLALNATDASEFVTALTNRKYPRGGSIALSSVNALAGDRIVVEVGWSKFENATTSRTGTLRLGNAAGTDLAEDETTTTDNVPWLEFDSAITFSGPLARVTQQPARTLIVPNDANARVTQQPVRVLVAGPNVTTPPSYSWLAYVVWVD